MPTKNRWLVHLKSVWQKEKPKGTSYKATMSIAQKSYRKGSKAPEEDAAPKKRRRRKKKAS